MDLRQILNPLSDAFSEIGLEKGLLSKTNRLFSDSPIDAFRHAGSSMLVTDILGETAAETFGNWNEQVNLSYSEKSTVMDQFNNYYGRQLSKDFDKNLHAASTNNGIDRLAEAVKSGVTINTINDPRLELIQDNLLPGETIGQMMERTGGVISGPRGMGYDLFDPRGPWQEPAMVMANIRVSLGPDTSIRPQPRVRTYNFT